ncbi:MAG: hypothetical protein ACRDRK_01835 [Pseudonocardia sp.]
MTETAHHRPRLVLGGTGKTGGRLVERLTRRHIPVRIGSRSAGLPFDWDQPSTRGSVFQDVVERVLGRPARDFADYARATAATGVWTPTDQPNPGSPR